MLVNEMFFKNFVDYLNDISFIKVKSADIFDISIRTNTIFYTEKYLDQDDKYKMRLCGASLEHFKKYLKKLRKQKLEKLCLIEEK